MPQDVLIPVLSYPSVTEAVSWLTRVFGFTVRWQIGEHRAQLGVGPTAAIAITQGPVPDTADHVMVRVDDVDAHRAEALAGGARVSEAADHPYGERQYSATDASGRHWLFTESIDDLAPEDWGADAPG
jgi:uncharacterized glyoxalase superfamily protein PhnB